jgi:uncharacterized protein YgbK (DUF1537 family)
MPTLLGCIADDFTGATDLAALLARSGLPVSLRIGVPQDDPADAAALEVIALKIRTVPAAQAVQQAREALQWLKAAGATRFFWKYCSTFDSTAEGNIGPVAEMLMEELGADQTIYCPAFPENGRSIFMGHLFVGEQLLSESPMRDHPLTPMRDSSLVRLLEPQVRGKVGLVHRHAVALGSATLGERLQELASAGFEHVIVDAVSEGDLDVIAQAVSEMQLVTGGERSCRPLSPALRRTWPSGKARRWRLTRRSRRRPASAIRQLFGDDAQTGGLLQGQVRQFQA